MTGFVKRFLDDCRGGLQVNVLAIVFIIATLIIWVATFTPVFMMIDMLLSFTVASPEVLNIVRICNIASGLVLLSEIAAYIIWAIASEFKREDQTFPGGVF